MNALSTLRSIPSNDSDPLLVTLSRGQLATLLRDELARAFEEFAPKNGPKLLTQDELAAALKVSTRTVFTMRTEGCPQVFVGESPRFEFAEVVSWLRARKESK